MIEFLLKNLDMKKIILSAALVSGLFLSQAQAQEKKVNVTDGAIKTTAPATNEAEKEIVNKDANVNFEETVNPNTMGQDQITVVEQKFDGLVTSKNRVSIPLEIENSRKVSIEFSSNNPNALYYITDRLGNLVVPATEEKFTENLRRGKYLLMVGLTPEAVAANEKAEYSFSIK